jgi:hypothetical protein
MNNKDFYTELMKLIESSNYGQKIIELDLLDKIFLENESGFKMEVDEVVTDYLFRLFDYYFDDSNISESTIDDFIFN